jgi:outer membrane protein OmpA-like peptidoglycan-associated protein
MKLVPFLILVFGLAPAVAQKYIGPPNNIGREHGNSRMPLVVSHLAGANKERLKRATKNSHHSIFGKILCFRRLCRIQSGHSASLKAISFKKFKKKVARNAKRGEYKDIKIDTTYKRKPPVLETKPPVDTTSAKPIFTSPLPKADSLIVLGAEVLFETNSSTLRSEHFAPLNSIVDYLLMHPERGVRISGHTDATGKESHNLTLSKQRADVVAEYLVTNGIEFHRVETFGLGSAKPITTNMTDEGRKKNRRVELLVHDGH